MSVSLYDSPEGTEPHFHVDETHDFIWFFEHGVNDEDRYSRVKKTEAKDIALALLRSAEHQAIDDNAIVSLVSDICKLALEILKTISK